MEKNKILKASFFKLGLFVFLFFTSFQILVSQSISEYETWFDNNIANRSVKVIDLAGQEVALFDSINVTGLSVGAHIFNIRFNNGSAWSSATSYFFYKHTSVVNESQ